MLMILAVFKEDKIEKADGNRTGRYICRQENKGRRILQSINRKQGAEAFLQFTGKLFQEAVQIFRKRGAC